MDYVLEAEGLTKQFSGFRAVSNVSLSLERGTIHALIGPNGAGKTTCFNLLTKFLEPTEGVIRLNGRDITDLSSDAVARLGMVRSFQISATFPNLTVLETRRFVRFLAQQERAARTGQHGTRPDRSRRARRLRR
jgi:branched-chain amino acid transport system ATP-binding protein